MMLVLELATDLLAAVAMVVVAGTVRFRVEVASRGAAAVVGGADLTGGGVAADLFRLFIVLERNESTENREHLLPDS